MEIDAEPMELGVKVEPTSFTETIIRRFVPKLEEGWPDVESALAAHGISVLLNLDEGYITVSTTTRTNDPYIIDRARDCIILLSQTRVPPYMAIRVLKGELHYDNIKTGYQEGGLAAIHGIKQRFVKQRQRLGEHLKEFASRIGCSLFLDGESATSMGTSLEYVMLFRKIVNRCIVANLHPSVLVKSIDKSVREGVMTRKLEAMHI